MTMIVTGYLNLREINSMTRLSCPQCARHNSVAVSYTGTQKTEYCFGAGCGYWKAKKEELTPELLELTKKQTKKVMDTSTLIDARSSPEALEYMRKNNCAGSNANIHYNLKDQRVVFNYKDLYVGRALDDTTPKWMNYTSTDTPFVVQTDRKQKTKSVVLVEDCASACNVSNVMDGIALLGTTLKAEHVDDVLKYETIFACLDEDATNKAMKIYDTLSLLRDCKIVPLKKDLKYCTIYELEKLLR